MNPFPFPPSRALRRRVKPPRFPHATPQRPQRSRQTGPAPSVISVSSVVKTSPSASLRLCGMNPFPFPSSRLRVKPSGIVFHDRSTVTQGTTVDGGAVRGIGWDASCFAHLRTPNPQLRH